VSLHDEPLLAEVAALRSELERERRLARHDPLTGALNRRGGREAIDAMAAPYAIALVDLDRFRRVNRLPGGYATGDQVLCEVATLLASDARQGDRLIRWGGEEFLLLLAGADAAGAATRLERFLTEVRRRVRAGQVMVTFSAGVAAVTSDHGFEPAMAAANRALQQAKGAGRARILSVEREVA
jgi:diguanylate cyclase